MDLNPRQRQLLEDLGEIRRFLRNETLETYQRINPFFEDLSDWHEKGLAWTQDDREVTIYESTTVVGDVTIGRGTWIGPFCSLDGTGGLTIGEHCSISLGCQLLSHDTARWALSGGRSSYEHAPTSVGDHCFLGTHAIITKGTVIGDRCLIAAGAVITTDVEDGSIMAGIPARRIGHVEVDADGSVELRYS